MERFQRRLRRYLTVGIAASILSLLIATSMDAKSYIADSSSSEKMYSLAASSSYNSYGPDIPTPDRISATGSATGSGEADAASNSQLYSLLNTDTVPSPWTAIPKPQDNGGSRDVEVWGRTYSYSGPLPSSILTQGQQILAGSVRLYANAGAGQQTVSWSTPTVLEASPTQVVLASTARIGAYTVQAKTRIEYDGFTWSEFQFNANAETELRSLSLVIPIDGQYTKFLQYPYARDNRFQTFSNDLYGEQYLFVGNDDVGLEWFAESDQWWYAKDRSQMMQVKPSGSGGVIQINMVRDPVVMPASFQLAFGLMATPVRPRPANWRGFWNVSTTPVPQREQDFEHRYTLLNLDYDHWSIAPAWLMPNYRSPGSWNPDDSRTWEPFTSTRFLGVHPYLEPSSNLFPVWTQYRSSWQNLADPGGSEIYNPASGGWSQAFVSPARSYIDFFIAQADELFKNYDVDGLYMDGYAAQTPSLNLRGFGYLDRDGQRKPIYPILAGRELQRRLYLVQQQYRGDRGVLWVHTSTVDLLPVLSFSNVLYDGEFLYWSDISAQIQQGGVRAGLTDDRLRTVFNQRQTGLIPVVDVRRLNDAIRSIADTRQAIGLFLVNDIHAWGGLKYDDGRVIAALDRWVIADPNVEFHPYFDPAPVCTAGNQTLCSVWRKPDRQALAIVVNDSDSSRTLDVDLNLGKLGYTPNSFKAIDLEESERTIVFIPVTNVNHVMVNVPARGLKLIALGEF